MNDRTAGKADDRIDDRIKVLVDMRPSLEGYAGIPQEGRLLFRGFLDLPSVEVGGFIQHPVDVLPKAASSALPHWKRIRRMASLVIGLADDAGSERTRLQQRWVRFKRTLLELGPSRSARQAYRIETAGFEDFFWRKLFARSLPPEDRKRVVVRAHHVIRLPWHALQRAGRRSALFRRQPKYPHIDIAPNDVLIAQTPYPGRVTGHQQLVIRYHDAIPVFLPDTVHDKRRHLARHIDVLAANVAAGAWFACISDTSRGDLLRMFPEAESRSATIPNLISPAYHDGDSDPKRASGLLQSHINTEGRWLPSFVSSQEKQDFYSKKLPREEVSYLLIVGSIEPRKNHDRCLAAWQRLRAEGYEDLKLVICGNLGWNFDRFMDDLYPWLERGEAFHISKVPAGDLRVLHQHARATICPSYSEGFDYPGVEAMASGGRVAASDIPVHREVFDTGCRYFDPYSTTDTAACIKSILDENAEGLARLRADGLVVAGRYAPERVLPQWDAFLRRVVESG